MKHWMDPSAWIHFQSIGQITHLLQDLKRTDPSGHKLAASLRMLQHHVLGTQKYLVLNRVIYIDTLTVRNRFLSLLSCIQKCPCAVSIKAQFLNKSGGLCRALSSARRTQGSTRVTTKDQTERRRTDSLVIRVDIGKLGPRQPFVPVSHCRRNEVTQIGFENLVNYFRLPGKRKMLTRPWAISGCVECRGHAQPGAKQNRDFPPERTRETCITVRNEGLTQSLSRPHVIHVQLGKALSCYFLLQDTKNAIFENLSTKTQIESCPQGVSGNFVIKS
jgi:hypothetical protein